MDSKFDLFQDAHDYVYDTTVEHCIATLGTWDKDEVLFLESKKNQK